METAKKTNKKPFKTDSVVLITEAYKNYLLIEGHRPPSVYKFCLDNNLTESEFYNHFASFQAIDKTIWKNFIDTPIQNFKADSAFTEFSARDKVLTFYFALAEMLKTNRSYVLLSMDRYKIPDLTPDFLKDYKISFENFITQVVNTGIAQNEIAKRPLIDKRYPQLFWIHMSAFLMYWKEDTSKGFEKTDAFIEKSVNLAFDFISKGALDSTIDFVKFLYQSRFKS